ncbi:hypothetical protein AnigIFM63309_007142 [Aspergillus niger]|uniref:Uncharacterized protein n=1 Tax=Aspergillus welwitschiae TaxID=1341132 RepID=A0A3F3PUC0_9EURO|nr:hypothetical protein BDQ94DRAFT_172929 [Aspergillus welwitschiae]RDH30551.1 hypothetical protein BDQ94DRAFT_172929 [Aspergillus welwitschiae]GLA39546.1 hypothetical protein AnigIFM63309_007142 [Aspergillus niger]
MSHFLLFIFRKLLNTFIYSTRHDPLLANAHGLFQKGLPTQPTHNVLVLFTTILGLILELAIRHIIGNVVMPLLILETMENQSPNPNKDDNKKSKPKPTITRSLLQTITTFHRKEGLILLLNGFQYAIYYNVKYFIVTGLLSSPIARFPEPLAHIIASVALAEYHFFRTASAVLPPAEQMRYVPLDLDFNRWDALLLPTLLYAVAEAIMMYVPGLLLSPLDPDEVLLLPSDLSGITALVRSDILVAGLMLVVQVLLLFPAYIVLVLVEGSLVPGDCETLISLPEKEEQDEKQEDDNSNDEMMKWGWDDEEEEEEEECPKQQGKLIKDIFRLPTPLHVLDVVEMISVRQLLYCLELHGQMCLCLVGVAAMVQSVVYLVS